MTKIIGKITSATPVSVKIVENVSPTLIGTHNVDAAAHANRPINTSTLTNLTGVVAGDGTNIRAATEADGDALPVTGGTLGAQLSAIVDTLTTADTAWPL